MTTRRHISACCMAAAIALTAPASGQSFGLDDNPAAPEPGPPGLIPGYGAENPFGLWAPPHFPFGLAPSPSLPGPPWAPASDGTILAPGPVVQLRAPAGAYNDALSDNSAPNMTSPDTMIRIHFSVDRLTFGFLQTALRKEYDLNQQPSDVFVSNAYFVHPGNFVGQPGPPGYAGFLPTLGAGGTSNTVFIDDAELGLLAGAPEPLPAGTPAPPIGEGTHDNLDQFDQQLLDADGDGANDGWFYVTLYPDEALARGFDPADIFDIAPGAMESTGPPFATTAQTGLDERDSIDALVMWDMNAPGGPAFGGPGAEPGVDYALFSLAPGSKTLADHGLSGAHVYFTDFSGRFFIYAVSGVLGIFSNTGGDPGTGNIDALEVDQCPDDLNGNGRVDWPDIMRIIEHWGACPPILCQWDRNGSGSVEFGDIIALLGAWGECS